MTRNTNDHPKAKQFIGKRVTITGDHPHKGRRGVIKSLDRTAVGWGFLVEFDDNGGEGIGGEDGCYVFEPTHMHMTN